VDRRTDLGDPERALATRAVVGRRLLRW